MATARRPQQKGMDKTCFAVFRAGGREIIISTMTLRTLLRTQLDTCQGRVNGASGGGTAIAHHRSTGQRVSFGGKYPLMLGNT